jgi:hypothetical protein
MLPPAEPPRLVIWGYLQPDSVVTVTLSQTFPALDTIASQAARVSGARVFLYENNVLVDTLPEVQPGYYQSGKSTKPKNGYAYRYEVHKEGFPILQTPSDTLPLPPAVDHYVAEWKVTGFTLDHISIVLHLAGIERREFVGNCISYFKESASMPAQTTFTLINNPCTARSLGIELDGYLFDDYGCLNGFSSVSMESTSLRHEDLLLLHERGMTVHLTYLSAATESVARKLGVFQEAYTESQGDINLFYEPVYLPIAIKGGYGYIFFMSPSTVNIDF